MTKTLLVLLFAFTVQAEPPDFAAQTKSFRETLTALVRADTTNPPGNEGRVVKLIAARLKKEKVPYTIIEFAPGRQNLVARLKGMGGKKPLLLLAHEDVVGTKDQKWSVADHDVTEKDGYLYGRGVIDDLGMATLNLETFLAIKKSGVKLQRDLIIAFTGDEESGGLGIQYLLKNNPELINAEIALNEGGGIVLGPDDKVKSVKLGVAEKIYVDLEFKTTGDTGHSSRPKPNNSIYRLAKALDRLANYKAEERLIPVTRAILKAQANLEQPPLKQAMLTLANSKGKLPESSLKVLRADPVWSAILKTTCVATMLSGGTKTNALPAEARANINCRLLPDETPDQMRERLIKIVNDAKVDVQIVGEHSSGPASPENGVVPSAIRELIREGYPDTPVIPTMATGASDSLYLRAKGIDAYGFDPLAVSESDLMREHGVDERFRISSIQPALELNYKLVLKLAQ
jgi:acetylornithine deacetylase/succinyl-diaminopimelate desuccinylase-like protein